MYRSRLQFGNDMVGMAFDSTTGELIELVNMRSGDNLLKNWNAQRSMPFSVELRDSGGEAELASPAKHNFLLENSHLKPRITFGENTGSKSISVSYKKLASEKGLRDIAVTYSVEVRPGSSETFWRISLENNEPDFVISSVRFPCVYGVYLGESWKDDMLVYPFNAGEKIENPVEVYEKVPNTVGWKWQEYKYTYFMNGVNCQTAKDGSHFREFKYSGPLSMMWLDYYDSEQGLYLACYDDLFTVGALRAETFGSRRPGMGFFTAKYPELKYGQSWKSPVFDLAVHEGDWHWGADTYRKWRNSCSHPEKASLPGWFKKSPGMVAHYDFKYQGGGVVHRFSDIPEMFSQARNMGLNHMLISGWHRDGFDNGFPQYTPDPDLGTEEEFIRNIRYVRDNGGHIIFYVNSQLCNMKYEDRRELVEKAAVRRPDGSVATEGYGDTGSIVFATMCCGAEEWREHLKRTMLYLVETVGADGIYLDQLGMARPQFCCNEEHGHRLDGWNLGYRKLLFDTAAMFRERGMSGKNTPIMFYEGVSDAHGAYMSGQLISTFFYYHTGAYPELYKYTFPEQILVDMVYPNKGLAMRPVHVAKASRAMINKAFAVGSYMWIYDLEEDNTFRRDPEQLEHLKQVIRLRKLWLDRYGHGIFRDTVGIEASDPDVMVKLYCLGDRECLDNCGCLDNRAFLVAVNNIQRKKGVSIIINCQGKSIKRVVCHLLDNPDSPVELKWKSVEEKDGFAVIELPDCELALVNVRH